MPFNLKDIADQLNNIQGSGNDKQESARLLERLHDLQSLLQDVKELENRVSSIQSAQKSNESEFPEKINIDSSPFKNIAESFRERIKDFESDKTNKQLMGGQKWVRLIKEVKNQLDTSTSDLQEEWKSLGSLNKEYNKLAWKKFRESLTNFYETKKAFYKQKKEVSKQNLKKKLVICERAEKIKNSTDWKETTKKLINLQNEWEKTGFTSTKKSNEIWKRFRTACDTFFKAKKSYYKNVEKEQEEADKEKEKLIKQLKTFKTSSNSKKDIEKLHNFNSKWEKIGYVPKNKININDEFMKILNIKFTELGLNKKELEKEQYKNKISSIRGNTKAIDSEQKSIRNKIEHLQKEIIQYENNIEFFGSGKATKPLLEQAYKKINNVKSDIESLKQKIELLNKA